ncbi:hypothetical protein GCM10010512_17620 [Streptomyces thermoviolaceus subsp. thermoviolaceus]|nr:hypothetical protein GCM10010512_17620 [Streptomyces thermoviolaceus subsp. thermoviolaceus]
MEPTKGTRRTDATAVRQPARPRHRTRHDTTDRPRRKHGRKGLVGTAVPAGAAQLTAAYFRSSS